MTDEKVTEPTEADKLQKEHSEYLERDDVGEKIDSFVAGIEDRLLDALVDLRRLRWGIMKLRKSGVEKRVSALEDTLKEYDYLSRLHNLRKEAKEIATAKQLREQAEEANKDETNQGE